MGFLYSQLLKWLPYPTGSYAGKTVIITGSNTGLGKEAAKHYARLGVGRLILAVRNLDKGNAARDEIEAATQGFDSDKTDIQVWQLDMASYASVGEFAARVNQELDRVDVFLANAGLVKGKYELAEDNEEMITVNVVSTFLLAALVMPKLKATAARFGTRPTLSITASETHSFTTFPQQFAPAGGIFAAVNDRDTAEARWGDQYPVSKLLEVLGVRAIADRYPAETFPVTVNCVNPGLCDSELSREHPTWRFWLLRQLLARSTEYGSRTLVHAGSQGAESHGAYLSDCAVAAPSALVRSEDGKRAQDRVWDELVGKLEAIRPHVLRNFE